MEASKQLKITKIRKTQHQNAPTIKTCKKTASRRGQTSKFDDSYTVLTVFPEVRDSQNKVKMGAKMEPPGTKNYKKIEKTRTQKTWKKDTAKSKFTGSILSQNGMTFS